MIDIPAASNVRSAALAAALALATLSASARSPNVFWIEPRSNGILGEQVAEEVGDRAGLIVLRARWTSQDPEFTLKAIVGRFKAAGRAPILSYGWANRYTLAGRSETDLLRNIDTGPVLAETKMGGGSKVDFLDITRPEVRQRVVGRFASARQTLGVDGFAIDLSTRTPMTRPAELARLCAKQADFCPNYARGMDELFAGLRKSLGPNVFIAYNGLFNFAPDQLKDQTKFLESADAAAIEYFGMDPNEKVHSFTKDIQPYLDVLRTLPEGKSALVFGRATWSYSDYAEDYEWQRYLYGAFLLAARPADHFKYHASFQVPAHKGRAGGMDYYADWKIDLGLARGSAKSSNGLLVREFTRGLVAVAPDDRTAGILKLSQTMYTPEGRSMQGVLELAPGRAEILLNEPPRAVQRPVSVVWDAAAMAMWKWPGASRDKHEDLDVLRVPAEAQAGDHDILLDFERSASPYEQLRIDAHLLDAASKVQAVAEVDDPKRQQLRVVVELSKEAKGLRRVSVEEAVQYRAPPVKAGLETWPIIHLERDLSKGTIIVGAGAFEGSGYKFRRWSHLRLSGPVAISRIELSNPVLRIDERR
jgi:hypothetical protein